MPAPEDAYVYNPIDSSDGQIRLLSLLFVFERRVGPLRGTMKTCYLPLSTLSQSQRVRRTAALPLYQALSYAWGDPSLTQEIIVDGKSIKVTSSLYEALSDMQLAAVYDVLVWADAICICQSDLTERSAQVLLMRETYQSAESVSVWLEISPTDHERQTCFKVMSQLCGSLGTFSWGKESRSDLEPGKRATLEKMYKPISVGIQAGVSFGQALKDLGDFLEPTNGGEVKIMSIEESTKMCESLAITLDRWQPKARHMKQVSADDLAIATKLITPLITHDWAWFGRSWVMQELGVTSSPMIVAGGDFIHWQDFLNVTWHLLKLSNDAEAARGHVASIELELIRDGFQCYTRQSLFNLIRACRHRLASDPRDKVFALIGLMGDKMSPYIRPDYTAEVREVFARATLHFIAQNRSLDPICGWQTVGRREGLPSWTPDYALDQELAPFPMDSMCLDTALFNASGADQRGEYSYLDDTLLLELWFQLLVRGFVVDTIDSISNTPAEASTSDVLRLWLVFICSSRILSGARTEEQVSRLEMLTQAARRYVELATPSHILRFNVLAPRVPRVAWSDLLSESAPQVDESYLVAAFTHCLFSGHHFGSRLKPSHVEMLCKLDPQLGIEDNVEVIADSLASSLQSGVKGKQIMVTDSGYIGTVRDEVAVGDLVCILYGCSVPVVLRKTQEDGQYVFMGEAYVHGLMDAEALVMQIKGKLKEIDFVLC